MQLTCRVWVYSTLTLIIMVGRKLHFISKTLASINAWPFHWSPLGVSLTTSIKSHWCTVLTTKNTTEKKSYIIWHEQKTTAIQSNLFLTGPRHLLVTNKGTVNNCQDQMHTAQSISLQVSHSHVKQQNLYTVSQISNTGTVISKSFKYIIPLMMWPVWSLLHKITSNECYQW